MNVLSKYPKLTVIFVIMVILFSIIRLFRGDEIPPHIEVEFSDLIEGLANQAEQLSETLDDGASVIIIDYDRKALGFNGSDRKFLAKALKKINVSTLEVEQIVRDESKGWSEHKQGVPFFEFIQIAEKHPDADAMISLCGPPYFTDPSQKEKVAELPKLLSTSTKFSSGAARSMVNQGVLYTVTIPRIEQQGDKSVIVYDILRKE